MASPDHREFVMMNEEVQQHRWGESSVRGALNRDRHKVFLAFTGYDLRRVVKSDGASRAFTYPGFVSRIGRPWLCSKRPYEGNELRDTSWIRISCIVPFNAQGLWPWLTPISRKTPAIYPPPSKGPTGKARATNASTLPTASPQHSSRTGILEHTAHWGWTSQFK